MSGFISALIRWAIFMAMIGYLPQVTKIMAKEAAKVHQSGGLSLGKFTRQLQGEKIRK